VPSPPAAPQRAADGELLLTGPVRAAQLFIDTVRSAIVTVNAGVHFVDSSPSNGIYSTDPYAKRCALRPARPAPAHDRPAQGAARAAGSLPLPCQSRDGRAAQHSVEACLACCSRCCQARAPSAPRAASRWGIDGSDPKMGDTHFYNYGSDCTDVRVYPRSKFVSEFGTQSYPSFSVLRNVTAPSDWAYDSAMSNYRCAPPAARAPEPRPPAPALHPRQGGAVPAGPHQCCAVACPRLVHALGMHEHTLSPSAHGAGDAARSRRPQAAPRQRQPAAGGADGARVQGARRQGRHVLQRRAGRRV